MYEWQQEVERMRDEGVPFDRIEEHINGLPLDRDRKNALWLFALLLGPEPTRRRVAIEALADADRVTA
jgi:hypothetical protein